MLPDGDHDALILDADDADDVDGVVRVELTITTGPHKGEVVAVRGRFPGKAAIDLLGEPATITVEGGRPAVRLG